MHPVSNLKSILIALIRERDDQPSAALAYALSLAKVADAHITVEAAAVRVVVHNAFLGRIARELVSAENRHLRQLATATAEVARGEAAFAGVACTAYPEQ